MTMDRKSPAPGFAEALDRCGTELEKVRAELAGLRQQVAEGELQAHEQAIRHGRASEELQHRARNTMALVRSAFQRTVQTGRSLDDIEMHFCGRLDVLIHYMLPQSGRKGPVDVEDIIRNELRNFEFGHAPGITVKGPRSALSLEQAQSFALTIHELTTNALKFGALCVPNATTRVTWAHHDQWLELTWKETGVPIVLSAPVTRGFGREYIEEALPYQTGAITRFDLKPGGVDCTIKLQLL